MLVGEDWLGLRRYGGVGYISVKEGLLPIKLSGMNKRLGYIDVRQFKVG